jgi:carbonic anhydrase
MRTLALGGGAALLTSLPLTAARAGSTDALLLTCMDYRLENEILAYMDGRGMRDKYDHVVLAGASLGALTSQRPDWGRTFFQHLDVAIQLHHIHKVIVIDHRDCGAYKTFLGEKAVATPAAETAVHDQNLRALRAEIRKRHSKLEVELGIMALDGKVTTVA